MVDWSEKCWKEMLIYQRKSSIAEDMLDMIAAWLDLKPGMTTVDIGCGLGYMGYTYWPYFGQGGGYIGVDVNLNLLGEARGAAKKWSQGGQALFISGDAYHLPIADNSADLVMCQAVLQHMDKPEAVLAEMVRLARPGGLIFCQEPDNLSTLLSENYTSLPARTVEEHLLADKVHRLAVAGRIKLGRGDWTVGIKIPKLMHDLGLADIRIRKNDRVTCLLPPYDDPLQQIQLDSIKKQWLNDERHKRWTEELEEEFLAGGGQPQEFDSYREIDKRIMSIFRQQIEKGEYFACGSAHFYFVKGIKP
jgi:SAM-dependent methyltransferase